MMKIAVFHELPPGGARRAMNQYASYLKVRNQVDLYVIDEQKDANEKQFYTNVFFNQFKTKIWRGNNWRVRLYKDTIELWKLYLLNKKIASLIEKRSYDIVFVSASKFIEAPFIMKFLTIPFAFYIHDPNYRLVYDELVAIPKGLDPIRYWYERLNRWIRKQLDKQNIYAGKFFLSPSKYISHIFEETYKRKNSVIYYGVDTSFFKPAKREKDIDIFYIGSREPTDGYDFLESVLQLLKTKAKVRVLLFEDEWISDDRELRDLYRRSKIVVCTAKKEGFGAVPLEAMACGVTVVATDEAGHKESVINEKTGYLLRRNTELFAKKIDWLLQNPDELKKTGEYGRKVAVTKWSWQNRSQELEQFFKNVITHKT